jgi:hypothetical protein
MRLIVSKLHQAGNFSGDKLIKYYRCLFQAALYRDNDAAFQVLGEVKQMIQVGLDSQVRHCVLVNVNVIESHSLLTSYT